MKQILILLLLITIYSAPVIAEPNNPWIVPLCKQFNKSLFDPNAEPFLSPTLSVVNATTNSGFFHSAYIPPKVEKPYFRITLNGFYGPVANNMKTFNPVIPSEEFKPEVLSRYAEIGFLPTPFINIKDTVGLIHYFFLNLIHLGLQDGSITIPKESATLLGKEGAMFILYDTTLQMLLKKHPLYGVLPNDVKDMLNDVLKFNDNEYGFINFPLPNGGDLSNIIAGVPQFEIGSLFGTELLVRFIPTINFGEFIGDFSFWGIGLKHNISQYFFEDKNISGGDITKRGKNPPPFDLAVQAIYQRTSLTNTAGVTQAELTANANIYCFNINVSKNILDWLEVYGGLSYERLNIAGKFKYVLPQTLQVGIGLMKYDVDKGMPYPIIEDPPEYPGDHDPQTTELALSHNQFKFTLGAAATVGPVVFFLDYSITKFPVLSAGLQIKF